MANDEGSNCVGGKNKNEKREGGKREKIKKNNEKIGNKIRGGFVIEIDYKFVIKSNYQINCLNNCTSSILL